MRPRSACPLGAYGIIPTRHGLAIGTVGDYAAPPANRIVHEADLVLFVGCHTGDQVTHAWRIPAIDTPSCRSTSIRWSSAAPIRIRSA